MDQMEAAMIVMNPFAGLEEEMAYCIHCLNPINPTGSMELEEDATAEYPMGHSESRGWLLHRAMDCAMECKTVTPTTEGNSSNSYHKGHQKTHGHSSTSGPCTPTTRSSRH